MHAFQKYERQEKDVSINRVVVSGNLTRDPEIRSTQSGTNILTFGIAVNDRRRNPQTNEWEDYPNFFDCVVFGARADSLSRILHKGIRVVVEGRLRYSAWERDGQRRSKVEIIADDIDFISSRQNQGNYDGGQQPRYQQQPTFSAPAPAQQGYNGQPMRTSPAPQQPAVAAPPQADVYDEDIPF